MMWDYAQPEWTSPTRQDTAYTYLGPDLVTVDTSTPSTIVDDVKHLLSSLCHMNLGNAAHAVGGPRYHTVSAHHETAYMEFPLGYTTMIDQGVNEAGEPVGEFRPQSLGYSAYLVGSPPWKRPTGLHVPEFSQILDTQEGSE